MKVREAIAALRTLDPELELGDEDGEYLVVNIYVSQYDDESGTHAYAAIELEEWPD